MDAASFHPPAELDEIEKLCYKYGVIVVKILRLNTLPYHTLQAMTTKKTTHFEAFRVGRAEKRVGKWVGWVY
jgi:hypothetical protein